MFTSEVYTLQDNTTIDGQLITAGGLVLKEKYICSMQVDTNWYWNQHLQQYVITEPTSKILHPRLEVIAVTYFNGIPNSVCIRTQKKAISIQPISLTDSDYDYILEEIGSQDKIEFEIDVEVYSDEKGNQCYHFK